ncbi:Nuclear transport factor 2 [Podila verticillata]|nr:Nuclear transport factor 2 [Podila verticillata]
MSFQDIANQFVDFYYQTFDTNRAGLAPLYVSVSIIRWTGQTPNDASQNWRNGDTSMLSFEGSQTAGVAAIVDKIVKLPFSAVRHVISTKDAQPVGEDIVVLVTGQLMPDGESNPQMFSQTFYLKKEGGTYFIQNDVFRLVYGA